MRCLCLHYKVLLTKQPVYIHRLLPPMPKSSPYPTFSRLFHLTPSLLEPNTSRTVSSQVLSMTGIRLIQVFVNLAIIVYLANH